MSRILTESQLKSLIRRTLREGFPEFSATPSYGHPDETSPKPTPISPTEYHHRYHTYRHFSGLSFKDALLQFLHQHINTIFKIIYEADDIPSGKGKKRYHDMIGTPPEDINSAAYQDFTERNNYVISNNLSATIREFLVNYCQIKNQHGQSFELSLRGFWPLARTFQHLVATNPLLKLVRQADAPSEALAQDIYDAILALPRFKDLEQDFNLNLGRTLEQHTSETVVRSKP